MSTFDETQHARDRSGKFTESTGSAPESAPLSTPTATLPYPYRVLDATGRTVSVDDDGDNQTCACGSDSFSGGWMSADASGRLRADLAGDGAEDVLNVCPVCGTFVRQGEAEVGTATPAAGCFDVTDDAFIRDRASYEQAAYGCAGAGAAPLCPNCGEEYDGDLYKGLCRSCVHNARRSGWEG